MTYLHEKNDNKKSGLIYFMSLIPLIIYGIYKNGILLYQNNYINFFNIFKPLILVLISLTISLGLDLIFNKKIIYNYNHLIGVIGALFCPVNISYVLYGVGLLVLLTLNKIGGQKITFNKIALIHLGLILGMILFYKYSYMNIAEAHNVYLYHLADIIMGRGIGGICTTSIILGVIIYGILSLFTNYKSMIPLICYISYFFTTTFLFLLTKDYSYLPYFSSMTILGFILVSSDSSSSPYKFRGQVIYAIVVGALTAIFSLFWPYEAVFGATLISSLFNPLWNKLALKC